MSVRLAEIIRRPMKLKHTACPKFVSTILSFIRMVPALKDVEVDKLGRKLVYVQIALHTNNQFSVKKDVTNLDAILAINFLLTEDVKHVHHSLKHQLMAGRVF